MIGVEGFFDEYVMSDELQISSLYLNFERKIKRKELERNPITGKINLSDAFVSVPSDGLGVIFEKDDVVAIKPQNVGDFDLSVNFVQNLISCADQFSVRIE